MHAGPGPFAQVVAAIGESDCERLDPGFLAQPVNAISSLAFSVVGVLLIGWARIARGRERVVRWLLVGGLVTTGLGSFLFHGPQWSGSGFAHDITFLFVLIVFVVADTGSALGWRDRTVWAVMASATAVVGAVLLAAPDVTNVFTGLGVVGIVASDIAVFRGARRPRPWYPVAIGVMVVAVVAQLLGRTDSPVCDPASYAQPHALWHVLAAIALGAYALATGERRVELAPAEIGADS